MKVAFASGSAERVDVGVGWVPQANPFQRQWHATPLIQSPTDKSAVTVDLSKLFLTSTSWPMGMSSPKSPMAK